MLIFDEAQEARKTEIREVAAVTQNHQQREVAEAGDVKFAVEQRMGSAVILLQEVRNWPGGQNALSSYELYTDARLDTAVASPREFACDVKDKFLYRKKYIFVVLFGTVWGSVHLPCHCDVTQDDPWSILKGDGGCCHQSSPSSSIPELRLDLI